MSPCAMHKRLITLVTLVAVYLLSQVVHAQAPSFEQAYAREFKELRATRTALRATDEQFEQNLAHQKARLGSEIKQSKSSLLALKKRSRELEVKRKLLAEKKLVIEDHGAVLQTLLAGAGESAPSKGGSELATVDDEAAAFLAAMDAAAEKIDAGSRLRVEEGSFFSLGGKQTKGKIVHVGEIAALGLSGEAGGVLLKIPDGYRVLDEGPRVQAKQIVAGKMPAALDVFLFSPECTGHDPRNGTGLVSMLNKGGPVAWVIVGLALLGLLLVIERLVTLSMQTNWRAGRLEAVVAKLRDDDFDGAFAITRRMGAVGQVLRGIVEQRTLMPREDLEKKVSELILKAMPALERSLTILAVITAVSPLLGLLGTVTGMISTFDIITEFGTGDPKLLSGGISEALITTKLGLAVAVPFLLVRSLLARWADRIIENMQTYSLAALNIIFVQERTPNE